MRGDIMGALKTTVLVIAVLYVLSAVVARILESKRLAEQRLGARATLIDVTWALCAAVALQRIDESAMPYAMPLFVAVALFTLAATTCWWTVASIRQGAGTPAHSKRNVRRAAGPYLYVRHPLEGAALAAWGASWFAAPGFTTTLIVVGMATLYHWFARGDETRRMGSPQLFEHLDRIDATGRFLPVHLGARPSHADAQHSYAGAPSSEPIRPTISARTPDCPPIDS
jgi:protein-S-isoprenylcysteine O-methyltransferase Ste14